ncbi:MAG: carbohydrate ABC transporter permease [Anaerolineae bacterium]
MQHSSTTQPKASGHDEAGANAPSQRKNRFAVVGMQGVLIFAAVVAMVPAVFMMMNSFKTNMQYGVDKLGLPAPFTLENYQQVLTEHPFFLWMGNSALLSFGAVIVSTIVASLAAFAISRMRFKGSNFILSLSTSLMVIPPVVMVIPLFVLFSQVKLLGTYHGVILIYAGLITPFSVFLLATFFRTIPTELIEAAMIDGASPLGALIRVVLPLSVAPLLTLFVVNLLYVWNDLLIALLFLPDESLRTLMVGISVFQGRYLQNIPLSMAGMFLASIPMLLVYLLFQRYFIRGLVAGAVKG